MTDDEMLSARQIRHSKGTMISPIALFIINEAQHYCTHGRVVMMVLKSYLELHLGCCRAGPPRWHTPRQRPGPCC